MSVYNWHESFIIFWYCIAAALIERNIARNVMQGRWSDSRKSCPDEKLEIASVNRIGWLSEAKSWR